VLVVRLLGQVQERQAQAAQVSFIFVSQTVLPQRFLMA
jgi:hypothetical protein